MVRLVAVHPATGHRQRRYGGRVGAPTPKRNRVTPMGDIVAVPLRGAWCGNRGILHDGYDVKRFHASDLWITCALYFQGLAAPPVGATRVRRWRCPTVARRLWIKGWLVRSFVIPTRPHTPKSVELT